MKIPDSPKGFDPIRYRRLYPVHRVRSVEIDEDATIVMQLDCLDDGPQDSIPGFENQPTLAGIGMSRESAARLFSLLTTVLAEETVWSE